MGWLAAAVVLLVLSVVVFAGGLRGPAVAVTVADDAVVRWLAGLRAPGLFPGMRVLAALGSWVAISALLYGLLAALLILRRWRQLLVVLAAWIMQGLIIQYIVAPLARRPRPFGVVFHTGWDAWALPSEKMAALVVTLVGILYGLVPEGRWRQRGKWAAAALVSLVAIAHLYLGVEAPTDVLVAVAAGVAIPLLGFRLLAPGEVFPVTYRRGRAAHLDVGGSRGQAIRRALEDQLGLVADDVEPFGLAGSAGSTPLRITLKGDPGAALFGKLYARSHLRSDRWYKLGRELLYGRLEDEKPFHTVRRLVQQEDYALRVVRDGGLPAPAPYGFVELTPEREYLLVTEFFDGATELGEAEVEVEVGIIDDGLRIIRKLWDAGLAHRDIKPANLLVRNGQLLLIDVAFVEARPTPWRQAVDLANMMLCLALRSSADQVYQRALRQFTVEEITEGFAAARGLALPSQLRRMLRDKGRDLHGEFLQLLPERPRPIRIQRWSARRAGLLLLVVSLAALLVPAAQYRAGQRLPAHGAAQHRQPGLRRARAAVAAGPVGPIGGADPVRARAAGRLGGRDRESQERPVGIHPRPRHGFPGGDRPAHRRLYHQRRDPAALKPARGAPLRTGRRPYRAAHLVHGLHRRLHHRPAPPSRQYHRIRRRSLLRHRLHHPPQPAADTRRAHQRATPPRPGRNTMTAPSHTQTAGRGPEAGHRRAMATGRRGQVGHPVRRLHPTTGNA